MTHTKQIPHIYKRTFEALNYPRGSKERAILNETSRTSEYLSSYKYCIISGCADFACKTKTEAQKIIKRLTK